MKLLSPGEASMITGAFLAFAAATIASSVSRLPTLNAPIANLSFLAFSNHSRAFIILFDKERACQRLIILVPRDHRGRKVHHPNDILWMTFSRRLTSARK